MTEALTTEEKLFIERLKEEREKAKISQLDLALAAGISQNLVNLIETGKRMPTLRTVLKLCKALKINPSVLFMESDREKDLIKKQIIELLTQHL